MYSFIADGGVNDCYHEAIKLILGEGTPVNPRGTRTLELHPAMLEIRNPLQRLVTAVGRPVNVAFALAEVLWILAGRDDVGMLQAYNGTIANYSDDGSRFNAAYGYRLRHSFGHDQLDDVIRTLTDDKDSRQAVLAMWDPRYDRGFYASPSHNGGVGDVVISKRETKDRACNAMALLLIRDGALDWTQIIRSNDSLWGTPYNWMQWTHIQEYVASALGVPVGTFFHLANSLHIYDHQWDEAGRIDHFDLYSELGWEHKPMGMVTAQQLNMLLREEQAMRASKDILNHKYHIDGVTPYWVDVLLALAAHHQYRAGHDMLALNTATSGDKVYGAAQLRFYHYWRWYKPEYEAIRGVIRRAYDGVVADWILGEHAPAS